MRIDFHRHFRKRYAKLAPNIQTKVDEVLFRFRINPRDPGLRNHALSGDLLGRRAIWVTGDIRAVFELHDDYAVVLFIDVGTHAQVYGE